MQAMPCHLYIESTPEALYRKAAEICTQHIEAAVQAAGVCAFVLSGGSTPEGLYRLLASETAPFRARMPWDRVHFFWGDERYAPPTHEQSNYRMAHDAMLSRAPVRAEHVHRIPTDPPNPDIAARDYEALVRRVCRVTPGQWPRFDVVLLGLGADGHIASLFPGSEALDERQRLARAVWTEASQVPRVTLTLPVFNNAAVVLFLVSGSEKADVLQQIFQAKAPTPLPAQRIQPSAGQVIWLVDRAAAPDLAAHGRSIK
jgi:6-phosphogluconolactonase